MLTKNMVGDAHNPHNKQVTPHYRVGAHRTEVVRPDPVQRYALPHDGKTTGQDEDQQRQPSICCAKRGVWRQHRQQPEQRCEAQVAGHHHYPEDEEVVDLHVEAHHEVDDAAEQRRLHH
jgi:hypothetical protein